MKYKLPRQIIDQKIIDTIVKEARKQNINTLRATTTHLKEIAKIAHAIETRGLSEHLLCKKLPHELGYGIFLHPKAKPILKGQIIAPYAGEISFVPKNLADDALYAFESLSNILLSKEMQARFDNKRRFHPRRLYAMQVDALKKGNFTRFINHSHKPNVIAELFSIPPNAYGLAPSPIEVIYLAKKTIQPGEQLLVSYDGDDDSYWGPRDVKPIPITPKTFRLDSSLKVIGSI